jgi:hypothetical protein
MKQVRAKLFFYRADLAAQSWLARVQLPRRSRQAPRFGHGKEGLNQRPVKMEKPALHSFMNTCPAYPCNFFVARQGA